MKSFLYKVLWFLIPLILLSAITEYSLRQLDNVYKFKRSYLDKYAKNIDVLILGSSHAYYNLNPEYIQGNVFNAGAVSQSIDLDLAILKKYESDFNQLKTILLPVSYFSFYGQLKDSPEKWRMKDYVLYYDLDISSTLKDHFEIFSIKPKHNLKKIYAYYIEGRKNKSFIPFGWGNNYELKGSIGLESTGVETAKRHTQQSIYSKKSQRKYNQAKMCLTNIVKWAHQHHVKIVLFIPPAYKSYVSNLDANQLDQVQSTLNTLSKEYNNCDYINILSDTDFTEDDFYDADHLNHKGSKKLSKKINALLRESVQ